MSTSPLSLLSKALDQLDGNALDETAMGEWAATQISEISRKSLSPEDQQKYRLHIKAQLDAAISTYAKGEKFFTPKAFVPEAKPAASPLEQAKAKLAKELEAGAAAASTTTTPDAKKEDDVAEDDKDEEGEGDENKTQAAAAKARPTRKAAPEHIGKDFVEADPDEPWPDTIGGSMHDIAVGSNGQVYQRQR